MYLIMHALVKNTLSCLRDVETTQVAFWKGLVKLGRICGYEMIDGAMETEYVTTQAPLAETTGERVKGLDNVVIINMLRTATPFAEGLPKAFSRAKQGVIPVGRDEETGTDDGGGFLITIDYVELPEIAEKDIVTVADPIPTTGPTMYLIFDHILENVGVNPEKLFVLSAVPAPDGLLRVDNEFLKVDLLTVVTDDYLDDDGYIVPGLGDAGDRAFRMTQLGLVLSRLASPRLVVSRLAGGRDDRRLGFG